MFRVFRRATLAGIIAASALAIGSAQAKTIRIAEHRQARIDALKKVVPEIEKKYNVKIEVIEYPAPEKDYLTKLLTELRAGNAPDLFTGAPRSGCGRHGCGGLSSSHYHRTQGLGRLCPSV